MISTAYGQQSRRLNLHEAIQMALDSNLTVRSSAYSVQVQKALKGASLDLPKTATEVKQVYWQLAYFHAKQKLFAYQDSLFSGFLRAAERRARLGETNRLEMITARSQSMEVKNQLQQVTADLTIAKQKLQTLLNSSLAVTPKDTLLIRAEFFPVSDSLALTGNPNVGYVKQQVQISQFERNLERSRMLPDFNIGYFSQTMQGIQEVNGVP